MFQRRIQLLLILALLIFAALGLRVLQVQVLDHDKWAEQAQAALRRTQLIDTVRGSILDHRGRVIAHDIACIDANIDFRVLTEEPDPGWVRAEARRRLRGRLEGLSRAERSARLTAEIAAVRADIEGMWSILGSLPGSSPELVRDARLEIVRRVEMRRRVVWFRAYQQALRRHEAQGRPPWFQRWLAGADAEAPRLEQFEIEVGEQVSPHPVLRNLTPEVANFLEQNLHRLPGLSLRAGIARNYPFGSAAAHALGKLARVTREDLEADDAQDELRQYLPSDLIGRGGLEALFEPQLRGTRGRLIRGPGGEVVEDVAPVRGTDVRTTLDIELQRAVQRLFGAARLETSPGTIETVVMHGAAVVIDVPTGEVRALVSYPDFDPNRLETDFERLSRDDINLPLFNRATSSSLEPGSIIKPLVGLSAIASGAIARDVAIECTGFLVLDGRTYAVGRCWTMSRFQIGRHAIPWDDPHPTGFLNHIEAIQRSCNIFFEVSGDRMGLESLSQWMLKWGLGRPTGIGIPEVPGRVPSQFDIPPEQRRSTAWFAAIGQGKVQATPLQMANVAATIARDGTFLRPTLRAGQPPQPVDLGLPPEAVRDSRLGMVRVVNTRAGTANALRRPDLVIAGKTGTAQAAPFTVPRRDPAGNLVRDERGRVIRDPLRISTRDNPNPLAPWYRGTGPDGTDLAHAWFIGYAPADNPRIAFAVLVEYGGGGGAVAGPIARDIIQACIDAGLLAPSADTVGWISHPSTLAAGADSGR